MTIRLSLAAFAASVLVPAALVAQPPVTPSRPAAPETTTPAQTDTSRGTVARPDSARTDSAVAPAINDSLRTRKDSITARLDSLKRAQRAPADSGRTTPPASPPRR